VEWVQIPCGVVEIGVGARPLRKGDGEEDEGEGEGHQGGLKSCAQAADAAEPAVPVVLELFSLDGCNDLLVFHQAERDDVFKNLLALNVPRANSRVKRWLHDNGRDHNRAGKEEQGVIWSCNALGSTYIR
jgi:hypothetical protein